jgi:hypothetical protein
MAVEMARRAQACVRRVMRGVLRKEGDEEDRRLGRDGHTEVGMARVRVLADAARVFHLLRRGRPVDGRVTGGAES